MTLLRILIPAMSALSMAVAAVADSIPISSYDIEQTPRPGFGCWFHAYDGTITNTGRTVSDSVTCAADANQIADYSGGSGTLNDGVISTGTDGDHLFVTSNADDGQPIAPVITLHLNGTYYISRIRLFGGDIQGNTAPGALTGATVEIGGSSVSVPAIPFGTPNVIDVPVDDTLEISTTALATIATNQVVLRSFTSSLLGSPFDQFSIAEIEVVGTPVTASASGHSRAYVLNYAAGTVSVIDTGTNTVIGPPITVNALPTGIAATPNGARVYLTDDDNTVSVIETATNSVIGHVTVGMGSAGIAIGPDGRRAYVANYGDNTVSVIDTATNTTVGAPIPVGANPIAVAITPDGARAYVANNGDSSVSVIDTALNTVIGAPIGSVPSWPSPCALAITPDGTHVYVVNASGSAVVISTATNTVVGAPVPIGDMNLVCIAFTPDGTRGYVTYHNNTVAVLDPATNTPIGPPIIIPGLFGSFASAPTGLAITPDGKRVYVANNASNTVSVIDTATNTLVEPMIDVGAGPFAIAIVPPLCEGACTVAAVVGVDDILKLVHMSLNPGQSDACSAGHPEGEPVTTEDLIVAVNNLLAGCPTE
jgi:YVTN family beta-propeller protein